ncbi:MULTISPECIES: diguanylate cyclase [unclassified Oceanispirochaeta]|uniref:diguanylate cyclase n=1 Tax=unclassified Oceanispirochaeta TaxID=2635722 RepID=UPI000E095F82|nr:MULTISPECIES: diguanylate cyclase [unclassified Oceanispirochaeta]MBF9014154.1 diguanylate cyclase [Oceanispirochaeta sp. M2]NPD70644.1 diguanylate cyclase [Oceanispirochaeta sp. M1]RDG34406.1 diguanylate cyclase [Oceanispirochaeta sp. M1]
MSLKKNILVMLITLVPLFYLQSETLTIAVLAKDGQQETLDRWIPLATYLTQQLDGYSFWIVPLDFDDMMTAVEKNKVDFVLTNSLLYISFEINYGINRLATLKNLRGEQDLTEFGGVLFTRSDRIDLNFSRDLNGRTLAAVDPSSIGGWYSVAREMKQENFDPYRDLKSLEFLGDHFSVVEAVKNRKVDAGIVRTDTLEYMADQGLINLKDFSVINPYPRTMKFNLRRSTELYPEWPFASMPHISQRLSEQVAIALISMDADSETARRTMSAGWTIPLNYKAVHDCMRELHIPPYEIKKPTFALFLKTYYWQLFLTVLALATLIVLAMHASSLNTRLQRLSESDTLTGLANRRAALSFLDYLQNSYNRNKTIYSIALIDLDHFKDINDTHGHTTGDEVLKDVSSFLRSSLRKVDMVSRWGGEEFLIILPDTDLENAFSLINKLRISFSNRKVSSSRLSVTFSGGIAVVHKGGSPESMISEADTSLYRAKETGRNKIIL